MQHKPKLIFAWLATLFACLAFSTLASAQVTAPYFEDFDSEATCGGACGNACVLSTTGWTNDTTNDDGDWQVFAGSTGSSFSTGPSSDHTTGSGNYLYTEGSTPCTQDEHYLLSPLMDLTTDASPQLGFWYHQRGADMGTLHVDIDDGNGFVLDAITPLSDNVNAWQFQTVDLSAYAGQIITVRFRGITGTGFASDMAIDDVSLIDLADVDVGIASIDAPVSACGTLGAMEAISVTLANFGGTDQTGFDVQYVLDGGAPVVETVAATVSAQGTAAFTFAVTGDFSGGGAHTLEVTTLAMNDVLPANNTMTAVILNGQVVSTFPSIETFDGPAGSQAWVAGGTNSTWDLGTPAKPVINGAFSGTNSWVTNLSGLYVNNEDSFVQASCGYDFSALTNPAVSLAIWYESEFSWDGANVQSSIDGGATWQNVGALGDPGNWYNDGTIGGAPGGSQEGWTGRNGSGSNGWIVAVHNLSGLAGQAQVDLRVAFGSDTSGVDDGFAFDDVTIFDNNVEVVEVARVPAVGGSLGAPTPGTLDVLVQAFDLTAFGTATKDIDSITISKGGNVMDAELTANLWLDDGDGVFDAGTDTLVDIQAFTAGMATFSTTGQLTINVFESARLFVTYDIGAGAMAGETFASSIAMPAMDIVETNGAMVAAVNPPIDGPMGIVGGGAGTIPFIDNFAMPIGFRSVEFASGIQFPEAGAAGPIIGLGTATTNDAQMGIFNGITGLNSVNGGVYGAWAFPNGEAIGALDYTVDASAFTAANDTLWLGFRWANFGEEEDDTDNVFVSVDGGATWAGSIRYFDWPSVSDNMWTDEVIDLSAALTALGVDYSANTVIRFQVGDNSSFTGPDGFAIDEVIVASPPAAQVERPAGTIIADAGTDDLGQIGAAPQNVMWTLTNLGDFPLDVDPTIVITNPTNVTNVVATAPTTNPISGGTSEMFNIAFEPGMGAFSFDVEITSNDPNVGVYNFTVIGDGQAAVAEIDVQRPAGTSIASGMSDSQGNIMTGMNNTLTYTIENVGFAALNISGVTIANDTNVTATVTTAPAGTLNPGETTTFDIDYTVTAAGAFSFDVEVANDDSDENPYVVTVDGTGDGGTMTMTGTGTGTGTDTGTGTNTGTGTDTGTGSDTGTGTSTGTGTGVGTGGAGGGGTGGDSGSGDGGDDDGCGCSVPGSDADSQQGKWAFFGLALLGLALSRRRRLL